MHDIILTQALYIGVIGGLGLVAGLSNPRNFRLHWLGIALLLIVINAVLLNPTINPLPQFPGTQWNWTGKLLSFASFLAIATLPGFNWASVGLTLRQKKGALSAWVVFAIFAMVIFAAAVKFGSGRSDLETIAFQWTMPGMEEELFYRGVLLFAFNVALLGRVKILGTSFGYGGLLVTLLFGLGHALFFKHGAIGFDSSTFLMTSLPSLLLLWMREKTGSLVLPVLAHNVVNGAFTLF
jgi:membrane protease YdiL (CAAX protease family)